MGHRRAPGLSVEQCRHPDYAGRVDVTGDLRAAPTLEDDRELATHLTLAEIGQRLYVSKHTVKTQAISIYRKLGASPRSQAVQRLQEIGA